MVKKSQDWKFGIESLLELGSEDVEISDQESGLDYGEYLKLLLYTKTTNALLSGVLDMVENSIQEKFEENTFYVDQCVAGLSLVVSADV